MNRMLTYGQTAKALHVSIPTLRRWVDGLAFVRFESQVDIYELVDPVLLGVVVAGKAGAVLDECLADLEVLPKRLPREIEVSCSKVLPHRTVAGFVIFHLGLDRCDRDAYGESCGVYCFLRLANRFLDLIEGLISEICDGSPVNDFAVTHCFLLFFLIHAGTLLLFPFSS